MEKEYECFAVLTETIKKQADEIMEESRHEQQMAELYQPTVTTPNASMER